MSGVENASDAGEVACNKPEMQANYIELYVFFEFTFNKHNVQVNVIKYYILPNALRLRFRLVSPEAGSSIKRSRIHSALRTRRLVVPSPPHPNPLPKGRGSQEFLRPRVSLRIQRFWTQCLVKKRRRFMILQQLTLRDFGLFKGRQVLDLAPTKSAGRGRPIVLFGGVNGAGKTTILDAIQLVLYGVRARCSKRSNLPYEEFLARSIHQGIESATSAEILLLFHTVAEEQDAYFEVRRSWHVREGRLKEILSVFKDGVYDAWYSDNWPQQVEDGPRPAPPPEQSPDRGSPAGSGSLDRDARESSPESR